ncbi:MmcQ/YjbR family DNA-binding protein [Nocardioides daejeonensis]|uniref:MmcQ/YjbR family DNA-binding protein n=1 Tax=Nocardioides daejeonensis TaxID=1046556 RepID=UPI001EF60DBF|nr:MmcQ/YjbR family DNA-binding protein [Nocardioides daejeonensis]
MAKKVRAVVPEWMVDRIRGVVATLPRAVEEDAWVGVRWRVGGATFAHIFGGEDQLLRITLRGEADEVAAFQHLGPRYFKTEWGGNVIGMVLDDETDWTEVAELVTDSYCLRAPAHLADAVVRPTR